MLRVYDYNKRAISSYSKCGFREIGRWRKAKFVGGKRYDIVFMDIVKEEFKGLLINKILRYMD